LKYQKAVICQYAQEGSELNAHNIQQLSNHIACTSVSFIVLYLAGPVDCSAQFHLVNVVSISVNVIMIT